jgi:hypothetical protein
LREEQHQQVLRRRQEMEREAKKLTGSRTSLSEDTAPRMATRHQADEKQKHEQLDKQKLRLECLMYNKYFSFMVADIFFACGKT